MAGREPRDAKAERQARLAAALRTNLRRRKEQTHPEEAEIRPEDGEEDGGSPRRA